MSTPLWVFDCDGVLLDSNAVKTEAVRRVAEPYGQDVADALVAYHLERGGLSRHAKVDYLLDVLLAGEADEKARDRALVSFGIYCREGLAAVEVEADAVQLLDAVRAGGAQTAVVSGGLESEVRWALETHGLADRFDWILGSPSTKVDLVARLLTDPGIHPAVFVGDSRLDLEVAAAHRFVAVLVTQWTEFDDWAAYVNERPDVVVVRCLRDVLDGLADLGALAAP